MDPAYFVKMIFPLAFSLR